MSKPDLPHRHAGGRDDACAAAFDPAEIGWLAIEAGAALLRAGRATASVRSDGRTALGRLAGDPRLEALAAASLGAPADVAGASVGRAAALRGCRHGRVDLFVVLAGGGESAAGCVCDDLGSVPSDALVLTVGFVRLEPADRRLDPTRPQPGDLWPPAAVVAG